jgi:K+-sensing histidine kinase KdpD
MSLVDETRPEPPHDPRDQLRHDLKTPLTTIHARAQLLARGVRRSSSLSEEEQTRMLAGLAVIEAAVLTMVTRIDGMGREGGDSRDN